jgi:hypothetical protein
MIVIWPSQNVSNLKFFTIIIIILIIKISLNIVCISQQEIHKVDFCFYMNMSSEALVVPDTRS